MFNRKKKEIAKLKQALREASDLNIQKAVENDNLERANTFLNDKVIERNKEHGEDLRTIRALTTERNRAVEEAKQLKENCDALLGKQEELLEMLKKAEVDKQMAELQNNSLRELLRKTECIADCMHRSNHNACRTCTRYPYAKDKYEGTSNGDE